MSDLLTKSNLWLIFTFTTGLVSIFQLLEYLVTKNVPWLFRFISRLWKKIRQHFAGGDPAETPKLIVNFSGHPVLPGQQKAIERIKHWTSSKVINVALGNVAEDHHFVSAIEKAINKIELTPDEWQSIPLVVIPSGYSLVWSVVQAVLHGRLGHFPDVVRLRPTAPLSTEKFEVAEIMNLHDVRHASRDKR
ncbi:MAG TPA: CRISPR-associated protein Csx15 [Negativicutes bacterium]|nr:CRISPR-associated protein Csx15 [Negativicutes bacterium]